MNGPSLDDETLLWGLGFIVCVEVLVLIDLYVLKG